jgi:hypothetical protein
MAQMPRVAMPSGARLRGRIVELLRCQLGEPPLELRDQLVMSRELGQLAAVSLEGSLH